MRRISQTKREIIRSHTITYFNLLNLVLALLVILSGQYKNMLFMGIVISNSLIGIIQELKVKKLIDSLSVLTCDHARLVREDGTIERIDSEKLQVGDILQLEAGDQLIADGTVITSRGLELNESVLTGESETIAKKEGDSLLSGSFVAAGSGTAKVLHTQSDCYARQLEKKARSKKRASSQMQDAIKKMIRIVSYAILPIGGILFYMQYYRAHESLSDSLVNTVAGVLGMIPEGLVLLTSVSFILGVGRLAKKKALVQEMEAIEALARANVLCLDKTGTITTGNLQVEKIIRLDKTPLSEIHVVIHSIVSTSHEKNATSIALENYFHSEKKLVVTGHLPFHSARKYMGISTRDNECFVLGAPDILCSEKVISDQIASYTSEGLRTLILCRCDSLEKSPALLGKTHPIALIILSDQLKEDAAEMFRFFQQQGVSVKILSGDHPSTVSAVGRQAGISGARHCVDATEMSERDFARPELIQENTVFGRVSPEQKQQIIHTLQASGNIVAMVGDGVNDVLALKDADCGIAMANGTPAARQSAHIVLLDSDFSSMKNIIKEGRTIISNIERVSALYLTKTIYSILLCILFTILGRPYPFIPIQLSLIGATAIGIPSFILTLEQDGDVTSTGFLRHVLRHSLPGALSFVLSLLIVQYSGHLLHWSDEFIHTLNLILGGSISIGVVIFVCQPMTHRRLLLCTVISVLFAGAIFLFPSFFEILPIVPLTGR